MILVTGATGQIGGEIVAQLPGVRAFVREPVEIEGAETVVGSFDDLGSLRTALDGIDTLFLTGRDNPDQVDQHIRVLDAARDAAVRHVVKLSAIGARADSPVALMRWHHAIEERLRASDFAWTFLRPHLFMQNLLRFAGDVAEKGVIAAPMSHREFPLVDTRDVSQAAAVVLRDPGAHAGQVYTLTGPQALSYDDVAHAIGELVGEEVTYAPRTAPEFRAGLLAAGIPEWRADDLAGIAGAYTDEENEPTDDLSKLLGRPATSRAQFLSDHRDRYESGLSRSHL
jgi:uncharacterized protein YbjT (DUF2867 family)